MGQQQLFTGSVLNTAITITLMFLPPGLSFSFHAQAVTQGLPQGAVAHSCALLLLSAHNQVSCF